MRGPKTALIVAVVVIVVSATILRAQQMRAGSAGVAAASTAATAKNPSLAGRSARQLLRNGLDYLDNYNDHERALVYLDEADSRPVDLDDAELKQLRQGLDRARRALRQSERGETASAEPRPRGRSTTRPGALVLAPAPRDPAPEPIQQVAAEAEGPVEPPAIGLPPLPAPPPSNADAGAAPAEMPVAGTLPTTAEVPVAVPPPAIEAPPLPEPAAPPLPEPAPGPAAPPVEPPALPPATPERLPLPEAPPEPVPPPDSPVEATPPALPPAAIEPPAPMPEPVAEPSPPPAIAPRSPSGPRPAAPAGPRRFASEPRGAISPPPAPAVEELPPLPSPSSASANPVPAVGTVAVAPVSPSEAGLRPESLREVEEMARVQEENLRRNPPPMPLGSQTSVGGSAAGGSGDLGATSRLQLPRAPSPTEARPIRVIPVPDQFVPLPPRQWEPNRKYWAAAATCHMPLYFQDAVLERYGQGVEQSFGEHGRYFSYPLDDPRQSNQRNQLLQPLYSSGMFITQIALLPYNMIMDPPWEAQYDLGYYRPGDRVPPDTYYLPKTGIGPPLHGRRY